VHTAPSSCRHRILDLFSLSYFLNGRSLTAKVVDDDSIHVDLFKVRHFLDIYCGVGGGVAAAAAAAVAAAASASNAAAADACSFNA
jgi:tRNA/tmRNA/rRNA uracil-C5-methylase (TrmA/RlmC/RlmD family)